LEGVEDAAEAKIVTGTALREAGATGIEIEPRTLKEKLTIGLTICGILFAIVFGAWYLMRTRTSGQEDLLMAEARREFDALATDLPASESVLCSTVLYGSAAEYALRQNSTAKLKEAHEALDKSISVIRNLAPGPERDAVAAELASIVMNFGGNDDQVKEQIRYRWQPNLSGGNLKINERVYTVHGELFNILGLLKAANFEFRIAVARRLTRELFKKGQPNFAADIIPLALFDEPEKDEARAVVALEIFRLDRGSALVQTLAEQLKTKITAELDPKGLRPGIKGNPFPASAHILLVCVLKDKGFIASPPRTGSIDSDAVRLGSVGIGLLGENPDEALKLALREGKAESQLKSLVLCAEWMTPPGPALEEAQKVLASNKGKRDVNFSAYQILRLAQIAAGTGSAEQAKTFANAILDERLRAWAIGDCLHLRLVANPQEKADITALELPEDQKQIKVGQAWGSLWLARHNALVSNDRAGEKKIVANWGASVHPFALAGIALGLQDR
jgi:hypothetical protein